MTFAIFIVLFLGLFIGILNILPTVNALPTAFTDAITLVISQMKAWNFILPISEIFQMFILIVGLELIIWTWHAFQYVISVIRGNQSGS